MTIFSRLLNLYKKGDSLKTPMEDFCTECLAGILKSDQQLLNDFVKEVLGIDIEEKFYLKTQAVYYDTNGNKNIIDMVFESASTICLLEMKVYSGEGHNQLIKYYEVLMNNPKISESQHQRYLRYCTLFVEQKEHELKEFKQIRWADIAKFLEGKKLKNQLIDEFYKFLEDQKMAGNERFTYEDLIGLRVYGSVTSKVDEIFNRIAPTLEKRFGKTKGGVNVTRQVTVNNRLAMWSEGVIGDQWSDVFVGFSLRDRSPGEGPLITVGLYVDRTNSEYDKLVKFARSYDGVEFQETVESNGGGILFKKPLADFLEKENQMDEIVRWINEKIEILAEFKNKSGLQWNVD